MTVAADGSWMPETRLFVDAPLSGAVELDAARAHYLRNVLRLGPGARVALFNGRDGEVAARVERLDKRAAVLVVEAPRRAPAAEPDLWLLFAPIKRARVDFLVEKATELGVSRLMPVFTERTNVERVKDERLLAICVEAAEQSERLTVPVVAEPCDLPRALAGWPAERPLFLCAEAGAATPVAEAVAASTGRPAAFLTGPEGGFSKGELDHLRQLPFVVPVSLGPRVLRADTAALAALACWQAAAGDWRAARPPFRT